MLMMVIKFRTNLDNGTSEETTSKSAMVTEIFFFNLNIIFDKEM